MSTTYSGWGRYTWGSAAWGEPTTVELVSVTGVSATHAIGSFTATGDKTITVSVTGVSADAFPTGGWGRSTWGSAGWGVPVGVTVIEGTGTSVSATALLMTSYISNVTTIEGGGISVGISSGVEAVSTIGAAVVKQEVVFPTGVSATITLESVDVGLGFGVTGVTAVPSIGAINITQGTGITVTANSVSASSTVNNVTIIEGSGVSTTVSGVLTTSHIGTVNVPDVIIQVTGVSAQGLVSTPMVWSEIIPGQTAGWLEISTTQSPGWTEIAA